jgi:hypothetical protein
MSEEKEIDLSPYTVLVAIPCYGGIISKDCAESLLRLQQVFIKHRGAMAIHMIGNESLITRARNFYVSLMLANSQFTHLMFIDSDIVFDPYSIVRMLLAEKDVVAGAYPKKSILWERARTVVSQATPETTNAAIQARLFDYAINFKENIQEGERMVLQIKNGFTEIDYASTGFMLVRRNVIQKMIEAMPELKFKNDVGGYNTGNNEDCFYALFDCVIHPESKRYLSEDFTFCHRWKSLGGKIYLDLSCKLTHIGTYPFAGNILETLDIHKDTSKKEASTEHPSLFEEKSTESEASDDVEHNVRDEVKHDVRDEVKQEASATNVADEVKVSAASKKPVRRKKAVAISSK